MVLTHSSPNLNEQSLNPIWTLKTKAFFLFQVKAKELFQDIDGLCFEVIDYDAYSANDLMGAVKVSPRFLYKATEERREFRLQPLMSKGIIVNHKVKVSVFLSDFFCGKSNRRIYISKHVLPFLHMIHSYISGLSTHRGNLPFAVAVPLHMIKSF